jgi:two-component system, chemotaxis family, sensor kinase CheA
MINNEAEFLKELLSMFKIEAEEHIKGISSNLLELEKIQDPGQQNAVIETIYREAHSLKGAARAVNLNQVETLCQSMESVFSAVKRRVLSLSPEHFDVLHDAVDHVATLIEAPDTDISDVLQKLTRIEESRVKSQAEIAQGTAAEERAAAPPQPPPVHEKRQVHALHPEPEPSLPEIQPFPAAQSVPADQGSQPAAAGADKDKSFVSDTIRITTSKLDSLLLQAEELMASKLYAFQHSADQRELMGTVDLWRKEWEKREQELKAFRRDIERLEKNSDGEAEAWFNILDFLNYNYGQVKTFETRIQTLSKMAETNARTLGGMVDNLLQDMKQVLTLPFSTLLKILPKVVRDLSRDQNKDVELIVKGSTIEIDRRILEEMKDPFIHLLRNCIDHGIEKPEERVQQKKPAGGYISIVISQTSGNKVEILVSDDGRGIDPKRVRAAAVRNGLVSEENARKMSDLEAQMLVFQSDISTSPIITDISGRGLGLSIVREKVEKLGGTITFDTQIGKGTTFRIQLPVTLATFRGILVDLNDQQFVIPTINIERVMRIQVSDIKTVENRETVLVDGKVVSLVHLADVLEMPRRAVRGEESSSLQVILLSAGDKRMAFVVNKILNEQEVLVKSLGKQLLRVRNIAGATILGSNKVVPILNVTDLMKSAVKVSQIPAKLSITEGTEVGKKSILVAEDSITSRTLLKNILESAGYNVRTSVDGVDALTALRTETFDLVVSDIEMPRMNGFDLVSKIRSDKKTADLPVILVTALESREDRERGIDVGANAYIVKRSFDQSNLLEVINKLI